MVVFDVHYANTVRRLYLLCGVKVETNSKISEGEKKVKYDNSSDVDTVHKIGLGTSG